MVRIQCVTQIKSVRKYGCKYHGTIVIKMRTELFFSTKEDVLMEMLNPSRHLMFSWTFVKSGRWTCSYQQ